MPKRTEPRKFDPKHQEVMERLAGWLRRQMNAGADEVPLALAAKHLMEHGWPTDPCKLCGAAKALIDCASSQRDRAGYEVVEAIRRYRPELDEIRKEIEETVVRLSSVLIARKPRTEGLAEVFVSQPGQVLLAPQSERPPSSPPPASTSEAPKASTGAAEPAVNIGTGWQGTLSDRLLDVLAGWTVLMSALKGVEERVLESMVVPSLKDRPKRWPSNLVETKVDCYLVDDGWTPREIFPLHHDGMLPTEPAKYDYIGDRVARARKTGSPPLLWGWRDKRDPDAERRLLELLEEANLPRKGKP